MESLLRKYLWVLDLAVAGVCALFLARATASLAESQLIENTPPRTSTSSGFGSKPVVAYSKEFKDIVDRYVFCSDCPPLVDEVIKAPDAPADPNAADAEAQKTTMPLTVMAIMYAPPPMGIRYSLAVLKDTETLVQGAFSVGDKIRDAKIIGIDETRIHFDNKGRREFLDMFAPPEPPPSATVAVAPTEKPSPGDELSKELANGLKKTGENTYELQRSTLDSVLGNMGLLSRSARIVPEIRDGKSGGFRLYAVRPEGPFALIGMQNGDVLYAINGLEMTSPEKALEVYSKLKSARHLSVSLERNGQKITKEYTIR
ncbi:MAG: type II secretion system protein GspC [Deltaproteobacteria bacterium]|nr:type II secretion system protein GspC [Deltaproteobacteria bacterium]